jgi:hypothetical protein
MYFGNTTLHVSGSLPAHHHELPTAQSALAYFFAGLMTASGGQTCIKCASADRTADDS